MKKHNKRGKITLVILVLILAISIGYAALTTVLKINSNISLGKAAFAIHFDNVETVSHKATVVEEASITNEEKTEISFNVSIPRIGDYYRFTTDIVNEGSIPGKVVSIELNGLTDSQKRLISYNVYYTGTNKPIAVGDFFGPNSSKNVTVEVIYELADDVENDDLPTDTLNLECEFIINFENGKIDEFRSRAASNKLSQSTQYMSSNSAVFTRAVNSNDYTGLYILESTKDDDFPIYFYRGGHSINNYVIFSGFCWQILRTTDTGGIKITYSGTPTEDNKCTSNAFSIGSARLYDAWPNSNVKSLLDNWYFTNIIKNQAYIEDTVYCTDTYTIGDTHLDCSESNSYSLANGKASYPIGLISAQEAKLTGMGDNGNATSSTYPWLHTGSEYWLMSKMNGYDTVINKYSAIMAASMDVGLNRPVRPVVSLNSEVVLSNGDGSQDNPYKVSLN